MLLYKLIEFYFLGGSDGKDSASNVGDPGSISRLGRSPGEENGNPFQYSCLENPHEQRSLAGYSPWGRKQSDTTDQLSTAQGTTILPAELVAKKEENGTKNQEKESNV